MTSARIGAPADVGLLGGSPVLSSAAGAADARELRATPDVRRFGLLILQLLLLGAVMHVFCVEDGPFFRVALVAFVGFAAHYWTPFAYKTAVWLTISGVGALALVGPITLAFVLTIGGIFYAIVCASWSYRTRITLLVSTGLLLMAARVLDVPGVPPAAWPVLGAIFMFRMMVYAYDLRQMKGRPPLTDYLTYFYPLPSFYFLLFPVIDFQTLRRSWYQRDIHESAQQGVAWMVRGTVQLLLYRMVYHLKPSMAPEEVTSFWALLTAAVTTYLLYLRVSGQFHIIVGMFHLFGYDLPETHRKYLLAHSLTDFWRRINIYWKDFMVKLVYFPVYFRLRRSGDLPAQLAATAMVFAVTWLLHSYQWFWLRGAFLFTWPDTLFWGILGLLVMVNVYLEQRRPSRRRAALAGPRRAIQTAGTFLLITTLWSLWNAPTVDAWIDVLTWWKIG